MSRKQKPLKAYVCGNTPLEISIGASDMVLYPTKKALKKASPCWKECGILEIDLRKAKLVVKGTL